MEMLKNPSFAEAEWLKLDIAPARPGQITIDHLRCRMEFDVYEKGTGRFLRGGSFVYSNAGNVERRPLPSANSIGLSVLASGALGIPDGSEGEEVVGSVQLELKLKGEEDLTIIWDNIGFEFDWSAIGDKDKDALAQRLEALLSAPSNAEDDAQLLNTLLHYKPVAQAVGTDGLLAALATRSSNGDGRLAIAHFLDKQKPNDAKVLAYYKAAIAQGDVAAITDISTFKNIWNDDFMGGLVAAFEQKELGAQHRIMDALRTHADSWRDNEDVVERLSAALMDKHGDLLNTPPQHIDDQRFVLWASVASLLGKTNDLGRAPLLCPFLGEKRKVLETDWGEATDALPAPRRASDVAAEALFRLAGGEVAERFKQSPAPPEAFWDALARDMAAKFCR